LRSPVEHHDRGNATVLIVFIMALAMPAALMPFSLIAASDARSRATSAADLIALHGCEPGMRINRYPETEVVECTDDGISVYVRTRARIHLPTVLRLSLFVHARAHAVHEM
jgi:hypothetical protein